jgi:hypothetical protein
LPAILLAVLLAPWPAPAQTTQSPAPQPATATAVKPIVIGVVILSDIQPGDTVTGTVVTEPQQYANVPGLQVVEATLPLGTDAQGNVSLSGVVVDTGDNKKQPAQSPLVLQLAQNATQLVLKFFDSDSSSSDSATTPTTPIPVSDTPPPTATTPTPTPVSDTPTPTSTTPTPVSDMPPPASTTPTPVSDTPVAQETVKIPKPTATQPTMPTLAQAVPSDYTTPPVYSGGGVEVIHGPVSGDSHLTQVLMDGNPCGILAEDPRSVMLTPPAGTTAGLHTVTLKEGGRTLATFHIALVSLLLSADDLKLVKGQTTTIHATIQGADSLPAAAWNIGFEKDLVSSQQLTADGVSSGTLSAGKPGMIVLHVVNASPATVSLSGAKANQVTQLLGQANFSKGPYTYNGILKSLLDGTFNINVAIVPLLAPIPGEAQ